VTLADNVHRLTREHLTITGARTAYVPALLDQLTAAVTEQTRAGSPAGGGGTALPIGEGALSLLQDIDRQARHRHRQLEPWAVGTLQEIVQAWATMELEPEQSKRLENLTGYWCEQITAIVNPTKPPRKIHLPCPACGQLYGGEENTVGLHLHCWDDDGALANPGDWRAECVHCGAGWDARELQWLAHALNAGHADSHAGEPVTTG
jgi:hypothetical protein